MKWGWFTGSAVYYAGDCQPNPDPWVTLIADTPGMETSCEVKDADSEDRTRHTIVVRIDKTAPTVAAATARAPDYGGWFNHPVAVSFSGSDATSGVASCSTSTYSGPDRSGASIAGSCQDVAGNVGSGSYTLNYDATPPRAPDVEVLPGDRRVNVSWTARPDSEAEVVRFHDGDAQEVVYRGSGGRVVDRSLRNGRRYRYVVTLIDQAGNRSAGEISAVPTGANLVLPFKGQRIRVRRRNIPLLAWIKVRRARYYNVQIFRKGRKVLSAWPERPRFQMKRKWRYRNTTFHLLAGRYCWHVWPGFGPRSEHRYGNRLGRSCFRIAR